MTITVINNHAVRSNKFFGEIKIIQLDRRESHQFHYYSNIFCDINDIDGIIFDFIRTMHLHVIKWDQYVWNFEELKVLGCVR